MYLHPAGKRICRKGAFNFCTNTATRTAEENADRFVLQNVQELSLNGPIGVAQGWHTRSRRNIWVGVGQFEFLAPPEIMQSG